MFHNLISRPMLGFRHFSTIFYTESHEWIRKVNSNSPSFKIGITHYAQEKLGDVAYVDLPIVDHETVINKGEEVCAIESTKACGDIAMPMDGKINKVNFKLADSPNLINSDPEGEGWLFQIETINGSCHLDELMTKQDYQLFLKDLD
jgi:glycine cleavage system H protein